MYVFDKIRRELANGQDDASSQVLSKLASSLEQQESFPLHELYELSHAQFRLALELMQAWRLARYGVPAAPTQRAVTGGNSSQDVV